MRIQIIIILIQILRILCELSDEFKTDINNRLDSITENLLKSNTPYWHSAHLEHQNREGNTSIIYYFGLNCVLIDNFRNSRNSSYKIGIR